MRMSLSLESAEDGKGAEMGVYEAYVWPRLGSADPKARGDCVSLDGRWDFSNSNGWGRERRFLPEDDSWPDSE